VLRRFAEYNDLKGAFGRRALTERAKGILMERHAIDEATAFEMLREQSRVDNRERRRSCGTRHWRTSSQGRVSITDCFSRLSCGGA
jgi:ANTAR domain